jgi:hypothetical protein
MAMNLSRKPVSLTIYNTTIVRMGSVGLSIIQALDEKVRGLEELYL